MTPSMQMGYLSVGTLYYSLYSRTFLLYGTTGTTYRTNHRIYSECKSELRILVVAQKALLNRRIRD